MSLSRRRVLQASAAAPFVAAVAPGLIGSAAATGPAPVGAGTTLDGAGLVGISLSWVTGTAGGSAARVTALVDGAWIAPVEVHADHGHGPDDPGRDHSDAILMPGATRYDVEPMNGVADLRVHPIADRPPSLRFSASGISYVEPIPGLRIITRDSWTSRARLDTVSCGVGSSVSGLGCRADVNLRHGVVHHTVTTNGYSEAAVPGLIRGIQTYHMDTRGWDDIGYNFVIDRFGRIWHARDGDIDQSIGAGHSRGFNTESVGVSVLGTFTSEDPGQAVADSIAKFMGWKLGRSGIDPLGRTVVRSAGGDTTNAGDMVEIRNLGGHRDLQQTACPGEVLYGRMGAIRTKAAELVPVFGYLGAAHKAGAVGVEGWAIDRFSPGAAVPVDILVDGGHAATLTANGPVWGLGVRYPSAGDNHGFTHDIPIGLGTRSVVARARAADGRAALLMDMRLFATFMDVEPGKFFADGVHWMRANDLTYGTVPGLFEPMRTMNRAQMATFLHRFMGLPAAAGPAPFGDVQRGAFYTDAVDWLAGTGITKGITATRFVPDGDITRAQMCTFLWRMCGSSSANRSPLRDVERGSFYDVAVDWCYAMGVTKGKTPDRFFPHDTVTRGEMAAFLHRLASQPAAWTKVTPPPLVPT